MEIEIIGLAGWQLGIARAVLLTALAFAWTMILVRLVGLRSFSKMTSFDFVATVATASLIAQAGTRSDWADFAQALAGIGTVFAIKWSLAKLRLASTVAKRILRNQPQILFLDGRFLEEQLRQNRVTRTDIFERLRAASVENLDRVRAVVLETTGDMTVLTGDELDPRLLQGVATEPAEAAGPAAEPEARRDA